MNKLADFCQQRLNLQNAIFTRIEHEDAIVAVVYKVEQPKGQSSILKICANAQDYFGEIYFLQYFADILPVPRILQVIP